MSCLCTSDEWLVVADGGKAFCFNLKNDKQLTLQLPPAPPPIKPPGKSNKTSSQVPSSEDSNNVIQSLQFSPCGKWFVAYSSSKQLVLWETSAFSLVSERSMPKTASSVKFTPDSKSMIIVDKAGDAILYSTEDFQREGEIILGHLSMLLDVVFSCDGKQIITCDRDEKIRVSCFPNAYNIISYCLGHLEFVSSLCLLPHDPSVLLSSSGDGFLKLWEFKSGLSLASYDCSPDATKSLSLDPIAALPENEKLDSVIVRKVVCLKVDASSSIACALIYGYLGCLMYRIVGHSITFIQVLCTHDVVTDICFAKSGELLLHFARDKDVIQCFSFDFTSIDLDITSTNLKFSEVVRSINSLMNSIDHKKVRSANVTQLLKRKFDNVKEYYEQKKARTGEQ